MQTLTTGLDLCKNETKQKHPKEFYALDVFAAPRTFPFCHRTLPKKDLRAPSTEDERTPIVPLRQVEL